jgi:peptidoglycan/LPS O-acetylase OafA/YrhL
MSIRISAVAKGRNNNFNLIRFLAASMVLVSHSFGFVSGKMFNDPLDLLIGVGMGDLAVNIFFITSGFLVTGSLFNHSSVRNFIWARVFRIYPALVVAVLFTVILGMFFSSLTLLEYFGHSDVWLYLARNMTVLWPGLPLRIADVFQGNPMSGLVNGSLWTLPWELAMYMSLATGGLLMVIGMSQRILKIVFLSAGILATIYFNYLYIQGKANPFVIEYTAARLTSFFFMGSGFYILKDKIILSRGWFLLMITAIMVAVLWNRTAGLIVINIVLAYVIFYLAYIPSGVISLYNQLGDYSYGVYIYAFPIQQSLVALFPNITVGGLFLSSFVITLFVAVMSWRFIEKKVMDNRQLYIQRVGSCFSSRLRC